jgi:hypothetical protein
VPLQNQGEYTPGASETRVSWDTATDMIKTLHE